VAQQSNERLKLSDAFIVKCDKLYLELKVRVINVNYEKGAELLKHCRTLSDYSRLVYTAKLKYERTGDLDIAVTEAVTECMQKGILSDFLKENGGEVMSFLYDMLTKEEMEEIREHDGYVRGVREGEERGLRKGKELGVREGELSKQRAIAANMLAMDMDIPTIAKATGLSEDEIKELA
jgi:predicted transposase/invertase (TIGR01784 family)